MAAYYASILYGALLTVGVSLAALLVSVLLGLLGAGAKLSGNRPLVALATGYTTIIRGIPELVLMLLVFYGGSIGINHLLELSGTGATLDINPFTAGVLTLGFIYGAYMTETFRGAILAIPRGADSKLPQHSAWAAVQIVSAHHGAANGALMPCPGLHQQLARADQGDRTGEPDRSAGNDLPGQTGQRSDAFALRVFFVHGCAVSDLHVDQTALP